MIKSTAEASAAVGLNSPSLSSRDKTRNLVIGTIVFSVSAVSASFCVAAPVVQDPLFPAVFGEIRTTIVSRNETLMDVARREGFGYDVLVNSNRLVDPWRPGNGTEIILPGKIIVPYGAQAGLIINLAELRLYSHNRTA